MSDAIHLKIKPVSTNNLYSGKRYKSSEARQFENDCAMLLAMKCRKYEVPDGDLCLHLRAGTTRRMDTSNSIKLFEDVLAHHLGINDRRFAALTVVRVPVKSGQEFITFQITEFRDEDQPMLIAQI